MGKPFIELLPLDEALKIPEFTTFYSDMTKVIEECSKIEKSDDKYKGKKINELLLPLQEQIVIQGNAHNDLIYRAMISYTTELLRACGPISLSAFYGQYEPPTIRQRMFNRMREVASAGSQEVSF